MRNNQKAGHFESYVESCVWIQEVVRWKKNALLIHKYVSFVLMWICWGADAYMGLDCIKQIYLPGEEADKAGRSFRQQYRSNIFGRWEARKEDWLKRILDCCTVSGKVQPGQCGVCELKPLVWVVPYLTSSACLGTSTRFSHSPEQSVGSIVSPLWIQNSS